MSIQTAPNSGEQLIFCIYRCEVGSQFPQHPQSAFTQHTSSRFAHDAEDAADLTALIPDGIV